MLHNTAQGKNLNIIVRGMIEPYTKEGWQRKAAAIYHVLNLLQTGDIAGYVVIY